MAAKKKSTKAKTKKPIVSDIQAKGEQLIGYQGHVTVSIQHGNRTIMTKTYHNSGMPNLFKFLAMALAGDNTNNLRPVKIKMFKYPGATWDTTDGGQTAKGFSWTKAWTNTSDKSPTKKLKPVQVSPFVLYDTAPIVTKVENTFNTTGGNTELTEDDYHYETTLHFRIPFSYISDTTIHLIGLYPNNATDNQRDVSAYYLFADDGTWDPLLLDDASGNYSIIIKWTMILTNKAEDTSTAQ